VIQKNALTKLGQQQFALLWWTN